MSFEERGAATMTGTLVLGVSACKLRVGACWVARKEESSFFEKKEAKKLFSTLARRVSRGVHMR
jgi:hypothetical protein